MNPYRKTLMQPHEDCLYQKDLRECFEDSHDYHKAKLRFGKELDALLKALDAEEREAPLWKIQPRAKPRSRFHLLVAS